MKALITYIACSVTVDNWNYEREDISEPGLWLFEVIKLIKNDDNYQGV